MNANLESANFGSELSISTELSYFLFDYCQSKLGKILKWLLWGG